MNGVIPYNPIAGNLRQFFFPSPFAGSSPEANLLEAGLLSLRSKAYSVSGKFESLLGGERFDGRGFSPTGVSSNAVSSDSDQSFLQGVQTNLKEKIYALEPENQKALDKHNADRAKKGLPPVDFQKTTKQIEDIMKDPTLSDRQKKDKIEALRKQTGLSKNNMKRLFTKRLAKIYGDAAQVIRTHLNRLKNAALEAEKLYGKESPQAVAAWERLQAAESILNPTLREYRQTSSLLNSLYPSFWSRLGGFFKSIGKGLLKIGRLFSKIMDFLSPLLRFIPVYGQMISFAWSALKSFVSLVRGKWSDFMRRLLSFANVIPGMDGILGAVSKYTSKIFSIGKGLFPAFQGNLQGIFQTGLPWLTRLPGVGNFFHQTSHYLRKFISPLRNTEETRI